MENVKRLLFHLIDKIEYITNLTKEFICENVETKDRESLYDLMVIYNKLADLKLFSRSLGGVSYERHRKNIE